jgi:hypothetical protein
MHVEKIYYDGLGGLLFSFLTTWRSLLLYYYSTLLRWPRPPVLAFPILLVASDPCYFAIGEILVSCQHFHARAPKSEDSLNFRRDASASNDQDPL